jgi:hypothetical protein
MSLAAFGLSGERMYEMLRVFQSHPMLETEK